MLRWFIIFCCMLNSGCFLFGPTYKRPLVNVPVKWPNKNLISTAKEVNLSQLSWWKQFNSTELNQLIQKALVQNNNTQIAVAHIEYAQKELEQIKMSWLPSVAALAGFTQFPVFGNLGNFAIAYPTYVINILQLYKQQKSAHARYEASIYAQEGVRLVVIAQVAAGFFNLIAQKEDHHLYQQLLHHYEDYLKLSQSQYRSGLISQDELDQLSSQINQIRSQIEMTNYNMQVSSNALHYLLNENPGPLLVKTSFTSLNSNGFVPGNEPTNVLKYRPDVREAEAQLRAVNAEIGAVAATLLPSINLGAYLGTSSTQGAVKLSQAYLNIPVVNLPVFPQIGSTKARYKAQYIHYIDVIRQALRDVSNDLYAYDTYSKQLKNTRAALRDEKKQCYLAERRYHHGIEDSVTVIQCKIKVNQFELMVNQIKLKKMVALVSLYQDLAGGYHGS